MTDSILVKRLKEKIDKSEAKLEKIMKETESIWEETGLDTKDESYLVEKTMRFEIAQKNVMSAFSSFKGLIDDYKKLCRELEKEED